MKHYVRTISRQKVNPPRFAESLPAPEWKEALFDLYISVLEKLPREWIR